jgi:DNA polymerase-1
MSVTEPALQTLPRDDKVIRGAVVPRRGNALPQCDLSQVEARLGAHFSGDPGLIKAFMDADMYGTDFFCGVAGGIYGENVLKSDPRRQSTKNVVYGSLYGAGARKMAETAGVPFEQMNPVKLAFDATYPGLKDALERLSSEAKQHDRPYITTPLGRRLYLEAGREYTQGLNSLIQGHAAEYFKRSIVNMDVAGVGDYLVLPVHDEVIADAPAEEAEEVLRVIQDCMTDTTNYRVHIPAEGKVMAERWQK